MGTSTSPAPALPEVAACTAREPQVVGSAQETGLVQPGSAVMGTSIPDSSHTGASSGLASAFALRNSTNVGASSSPITPSTSTQTGTAARKSTGCAKSSGTSNSTAARTTVAPMAYVPMTAVARVMGSRTRESGVGEATSVSSVPSQR